MTASSQPASRGSVRSAVAALGAGAAAGVVGLVLAQWGTAALLALAGVIGAMVGWAMVGDLLQPHLRRAMERIQPRPSGARRSAPAVRVTAGVGVTLLAGGAAWVLAGQGMMALGAVAAAVVFAVLGWLLAPLLAALLFAEPEPCPNADASGRPGSRRRWATTPRSQPNGATGTAVAITVAVGAAGAAAIVLGGMGIKGLLVMLGLLAVITLLVIVKDRSVFFTFAAVCSLVLMLHKSFSEQDLNNSGGAISIYVTTFDVMIALLYVLWLAEGTFVADLRAARSVRALRVPLLGALCLLPSLLVAGSVLLGVSELTRMAWMYLLFVYVAVRVRTRRHVWAVLAGLAVFALLECLVVVLQASTGGVLGLSFLGVPTELGERVTDSGSVGRPFGTIIHPVFMGAAMGTVALVALALALSLPRSLAKVSAIVVLGAALLPLYLSHTRAALVAFAVVAAVVVGLALSRGLLAWRTVGFVVLGGLVAVAVFWPQLSDKFEKNFSTGHFSEEVASRNELNQVALNMFSDHSLLGVGLNNFEREMGPYQEYGLIFADNPVHNLYLLFLAETGLIGLAGLVIVGGGMLMVAGRLARSRDRLLGGVGIGVTAAMAFLAVEELLGFSLRQDIPLALYWLLAGLAVACGQMDSRAADETPAEAARRPLATAGTGGSR